MSEYIRKGNDIFSARGRRVATLDHDGNPVMAPGMAGAHSRGVREFLALPAVPPDVPANPAPPPPPPPGGPGMADPPGSDQVTAYVGPVPSVRPAGRPEPLPRPETVEEWEISTIPADQLPPFSPARGVNTPGFSDYVARHKLTALQRAALVRRLEKRH